MPDNSNTKVHKIITAEKKANRKQSAQLKRIKELDAINLDIETVNSTENKKLLRRVERKLYRRDKTRSWS